MDTNWELPSLKATIKLRLGDPSHAYYDVSFYPYTRPGADPVFAVCGDNFTVIGRCVNSQDSAFENLRILEHENEKARGDSGSHNSLAWSQAENGDPLVCVAGLPPQIRVVNVTTSKLVQTLVGHGDEILDLAVSPTDPNILASCAADNTVRLWNLHASRQTQPLAAICHGQGHKDRVLTIAYHRKGRYILSGGMDTRINLWTVPDDLGTRADTDKPAMIHYPHFSTTEIHTDYIDSIQWYNDLIVSRACREDKIILWRIDNFSSDRTKIPPAPIPTSSAVFSETPVTMPARSSSTTRSAWGGRFQRLLQFDLPHSQLWYGRFSIYHAYGRHPILVAGNDRSKAFFWDLERLEKSHAGEEGFCTEEAKIQSLGLPQYIREGSTTSNASSSASVGIATSIKKNKKNRKETEQAPEWSIGDPFRSIKAHKTIEIPKYEDFLFHHFSWSLDGQWCVGVGGPGLVHIFSRWHDEVPPTKPDSESILPPGIENEFPINKNKIKDALMQLYTDYEVRKQIAGEQGLPFEEDMSIVLNCYMENLSKHEREYAQSLKRP